MKFKVAAIFQQGPFHLVKAVPVDMPAGDLHFGFKTEDVKFETHPQTTEMGKGNPEEHRPKIMIREGEHFTSLTGPDGKTWELGKTYEFSASPV